MFLGVCKGRQCHEGRHFPVGHGLSVCPREEHVQGRATQVSHPPAIAGHVCREETRPRRGGRSVVRLVGPVSEARRGEEQQGTRLRAGEGPRLKAAQHRWGTRHGFSQFSPQLGPRLLSCAGSELTQKQQPDPGSSGRGCRACRLIPGPVTAFPPDPGAMEASCSLISVRWFTVSVRWFSLIPWPETRYKSKPSAATQEWERKWTVVT